MERLLVLLAEVEINPTTNRRRVKCQGMSWIDPSWDVGVKKQQFLFKWQEVLATKRCFLKLYQ